MSPRDPVRERLESGAEQGQAMRRAECSEERIVGMLKEVEAGAMAADLAGG